MNPKGVAATYPTDSFPKADPVETDFPKDPAVSASSTSSPSGRTPTTWTPLATGCCAAICGRSGTGTPCRPPQVLAAPFPAGRQKVIGLTDTASAAKYQVFTAALRNPAGAFVEPTSASMASAAAVMTPTPAQPQVRALDYGAGRQEGRRGVSADGAGLRRDEPLGGDPAPRHAYAAFIRYAAGGGQTAGTDDGELPAGYAPLPPPGATTPAAPAARSRPARQPSRRRMQHDDADPHRGDGRPAGRSLSQRPDRCEPRRRRERAAAAGARRDRRAGRCARGRPTPDDPSVGASRRPSPSVPSAASPPPRPSPCSPGAAAGPDRPPIPHAVPRVRNDHEVPQDRSPRRRTRPRGRWHRRRRSRFGRPGVRRLRAPARTPCRTR